MWPLAPERASWYRPDNPQVNKLRFLKRIMGLLRMTATDSGLILELMDRARADILAEGSKGQARTEPGEPQPAAVAARVRLRAKGVAHAERVQDRDAHARHGQALRSLDSALVLRPLL